MELNEIKKEAIKISKEYRKANKLTQEQLADLAGVSRRSIQNLEHGATVYDETLQKILDACGWNYGVEIKRFLEKKTKE